MNNLNQFKIEKDLKNRFRVYRKVRVNGETLTATYWSSVVGMVFDSKKEAQTKIKELKNEAKRSHRRA